MGVRVAANLRQAQVGESRSHSYRFRFQIGESNHEEDEGSTNKAHSLF